MPKPRVSTTFNAVNKMSGPLKKMASAMKNFAKVGGAAVIAGLALTTKAFIDFDESITAASAKFGGLNLATEQGQETLRQLGQTAREVGATTKFSASEAAQGLDFLAMAGFSAEQAMSALPQVVNLATVAQVDLATATDIASDSIGAFGLMTDDATQLQSNFTRVNDVMAKTMTSSNTNMEDLFETIKSGAPTFTAAGQSLESFAALAGVMANSGVKGSTSGTSLRNVMLKLSDPTSAAAAEMKKLGVETQDENGNFLDIIDILADFEKGLEGVGTAQKTAALSTIFGARSVTGINVLLETGTDALREYRKEIEGAAGASQEMADIIGSSLLNQIKSLKSAALEKGFQLIARFGDQAKDSIKDFTQRIRDFDVSKITNAVRVLAGWIRPLIEVIIKVGTELFQMLTQTKGGQAFIEALGTAFRFVAKSIEFMWKIAKPIFGLWLKALNPIFNIINGIMKGIELVAGFMVNGSGLDVAGGQQQAASALMGRNDAMAQTTGLPQQWQGNLNIKGVPAGSTMQSSGNAAPTVNMDYGYRGAQL